MQSSTVRFRRRAAAAFLLPALALFAACESGGGTGPEVRERLAVIVNSVDNTLTIAPTEGTGGARTVGLAAQGSPTIVATRGTTAVVPLGFYPFAAIVDVVTGQVKPLVALPANSGATGVAFLNDSIAVVANSNLNTVTAFNVNTGAVRPQIAVGDFPQAIEEAGGRLYVLNANLNDQFLPAGPGSVTVLNAQLQVVGTVALTGINPGAAVARGNRLYVLNSGSFAEANRASLSVVNLGTLTEEQHVTGLGDFAGGIDVAPNGDLYIAVYSRGILVWDPDSRTFVRGPANPIIPGGAPPVSNLKFDSEGVLHTLNPRDCQALGTAYTLAADFSTTRTATTGVCPFDIEFVDVLED